MKKVLISGGSGLVGSRLTSLLEDRNYQVTHLSRTSEGASQDTIVWDVEKMQLEADKIKGFDHIIHLAGAGIVDEPWTKERMALIRSSRIKSAELITKAIAKNEQRPISFVSASAVGYYGFISGEHVFSEDEQSGNDYLGKTCKLWEESVDQVAALGIPTSKIRIGIVLSKKGGALKEMVKPVQKGFAASLGTGKQYIPWIHIDDLCAVFIHAMENNLKGAFNAAVPDQYQVNNSEFTKILAKVLGKSKWLPNVPKLILQLILGKRALLVLEGSRVSAEKILSTGFEFQYQRLEEALKAIYKQ